MPTGAFRLSTPPVWLTSLETLHSLGTVFQVTNVKTSKWFNFSPRQHYSMALRPCCKKNTTLIQCNITCPVSLQFFPFHSQPNRQVFDSLLKALEDNISSVRLQHSQEHWVCSRTKRLRGLVPCPTAIRQQNHDSSNGSGSATYNLTNVSVWGPKMGLLKALKWTGNPDVTEHMALSIHITPVQKSQGILMDAVHLVQTASRQWHFYEDGWVLMIWSQCGGDISMKMGGF